MKNPPSTPAQLIFALLQKKEALIHEISLSDATTAHQLRHNLTNVTVSIARLEVMPASLGAQMAAKAALGLSLK